MSTVAEFASFNIALVNLAIAERDLFSSVNESGTGGKDAPSAALLAATAKVQAATAALVATL